MYSKNKNGVVLVVDGVTYNLPNAVLVELDRQRAIEDGRLTAVFHLDTMDLPESLLDLVPESVFEELHHAYLDAVFAETGGLEQEIADRFLGDFLREATANM